MFSRKRSPKPLSAIEDLAQKLEAALAKVREAEKLMNAHRSGPLAKRAQAMHKESEQEALRLRQQIAYRQLLEAREAEEALARAQAANTAV